MEKNINYNEPIISEKYGSHKFRFYIIPTNATIEFTIDGDEKRYKARDVRDNMVYFKETLELFVMKDVEFIDYISLSDENYAILKAEQKSILARLKAERDKVREWDLGKKTRGELFLMIDRHICKTKTRTVIKNGKKIKEKYVVHTFEIGSEKIRYIERKINGKRIINPDYKIRTDFPKAGGIGCKEGELLVWKYYYELNEPSEFNPTKKKGFWETARVMRYSEQICYEIINRYGDNLRRRERRKWFFKKVR